MNAINLIVDRAAVLRWFKGKSLENASAALDLVEASLKEGSWIPGASRKVEGALNKANIAVKLARGWEAENWAQAGHHSTLLGDLGERGTGLGTGWQVAHNMKFGAFRAIQSIDISALRTEADQYGAASGRTYERSRAQLAALTRAAEYQQDMSTVAAAVERLNMTRPAPKFLRPGTVSPTVQRTLDAMGAVSIEVAPMEYRTIERLDKDGKKIFVTVCVLLWPQGTEHHTSLKGYLGSNCEACGHAIRNGFNWVPMLITTKTGGKKSLWVGRDCAKRLFEVELKGDLEIVQS